MHVPPPASGPLIEGALAESQKRVGLDVTLLASGRAEPGEWEAEQGGARGRCSQGEGGESGDLPARKWEWRKAPGNP